MKLINQQTYITVFEKFLFSMVLISSLISSPVQAINTLTLYNVETTSDTVDINPADLVCADVNGVCSLRAAIQTHNANINDGVIYLPGGTYTLSETGAGEDFAVSGDLNVTRGNLTIRESIYYSANPIIIEGGSGWDDRIFMASNSVLTLENITLRGGNVTGNGGAVWSAYPSSLILKNCRITGNQASGSGGGIAAQGTLFSMENCRVDNNTSTVDGGGIHATAINSTIRSSTIDNNTALNRGGGINADSISGTVNIVNATISSNTAINGGGLNAIQNVSLYNSSITNNIASPGVIPGHGGGIFLVNSLSISNSIVAGNTASYYVGAVVSTPDCYTSDSGTIFLASQNYNLIGDMTGCAMDYSDIGEQLGDATNPIDPLFGPLQDNGGPTPTHLLLVGSPAIDAGNPNGCIDETAIEMTSDQRGFTRSVDGNSDGAAVCDLGSVEVVAPVTTTVSSSGGGGCTIGTDSRFDPIFPGLVLAALIYLGLRRKRHT